MRRFSANYIYTHRFLKNGIIETNDNGEITNIIDTKGDLRESRNLEFYNGIIVPGFINTHCHLELSAFKNRIAQKVSLPAFIQNIVSLKKEINDSEYLKPIETADTLMFKNGIVAVGDIANTSITIAVKKKSKIFYLTFVEALGLNNNAEQIFKNINNVFETFQKESLPASIVPHAPYSVSKKLLTLIKQHAEKNHSILSIHNQETASENELFQSLSGDLAKKFNEMGVEIHNIQKTGTSSLQSIASDLPINNNILFIHNTYTSQQDIDFAVANFPNCYFCLCPKSNLYIENRLPDIVHFNNYQDKITLGTDSLASNDNLSILDEMFVLQLNHPQINLSQLINWATINGARALGIEKDFGSIEPGKKPGLNLIQNIDFDTMRLKKESTVLRLI